MMSSFSTSGDVEPLGVPAGGKLSADMEALSPVFKACAVGKDMATPAGLRAYENELVRTVWTPGPALPHVSDITIEGDGYGLNVRVYRPDTDGREVLPAVIWFHGGGMVMGGLESDDAPCRMLAKAAHCVIYNVAYRCAPEHPYPAARDDAILACRTIMNDAPGGPIDRMRIVIAGYSGGGSISAAACQEAVDQGWGKPIGQLLIVPLLDWTGAYSRAKRSDADSANASIYRSSYFPDPTIDTADPKISPLWTTDVSRLPRTFILTGELDPRREEAEVYGRKLQSAGVPVRQVMAYGMPHLYFHLSGKVANAKAAVDLTAEVLRELFAPLRHSDARP